MGARILHAVRAADGFHLRVHLDTEAVVTEETAEATATAVGEPHPDYVREWTWGLPHNAVVLDETQGCYVPHLIHLCEGRPMTEGEYLDSIKEMVAEMAAQELRIIRGTKPHPDTHPVVTELHGLEV